ncbi:MAG TPA: transposase [Candidatus Limnocylindrales bacterium]|nr:transposase [Candidatus Limnocylindrales bacterium]
MRTVLANMDDRAFAFEPEAEPGGRDPGAPGRVLPRARFARRNLALAVQPPVAVRRLLEPRRRHDWALLTVIRDAYLSGGATRRLDALARALEVDGANEEPVRHARRDLDRAVQAFRARPLDHAYPYIVIDAVVQQVRECRRVSRLAAVIAAGVTADGNREALSIEVGWLDDRELWTRLLNGLRDRGAYGVRLVTADAYPGIEDAVAAAFPGATWQRARNGFIEQAAATVSPEHRPWVGRALRAALTQPQREGALHGLRETSARWGAASPALVACLRQYEESALAFYDLPAEHRQRFSGTGCLAQALREIERHCRLIGIFPTAQSLLRLCGVMAEEHHEEWLAGPRYVRRRGVRADTARDDATDRDGATPREREADNASPRRRLRLVPAWNDAPQRSAGAAA